MTFKFIMDITGLVLMGVLLAVAADVLWLRPMRYQDTWSKKKLTQRHDKRRR